MTSIKKNINLLYRIIVLSINQIFIFQIPYYHNIDIIDTNENIYGLFSFISNEEKNLISYPNKIKGHITIKNYLNEKNIEINAHENEIAYFTFNKNGNFLATASEKGTLIRIFDTENANLIHEFRRGQEIVQIYNIVFSDNNEFFALSSNKGTIHIFCISDKKKDNIISFWPFKNKNEYSFAKIRINESNSICCFDEENKSVFLICGNGKFYHADIDLKNGGECKIIEEKSLI